MVLQPKSGRGRPRRQPLEAVRTIWWYWVVRIRSGLSESKLEAQFDALDRKSLGKHRSTRWNKYKFGRSSPSETLLQTVDSAYSGTRAAYEHDLWLLASHRELPPSALADVTKRLPEPFRKLVVADDLPGDGAFWLRQETDWAAVATQVGDPSDTKQSVGATCCFLLFLARLAVLLQDEELHFHAHLGIARLVDWPGSEHLRHTVALLVAILMRDWAATRYRTRAFQVKMKELNTISSGPRPPWISEQMDLPLGTKHGGSSPFDAALSKYFWMAVSAAR